MTRYAHSSGQTYSRRNTHIHTHIYIHTLTACARYCAHCVLSMKAKEDEHFNVNIGRLSKSSPQRVEPAATSFSNAFLVAYSCMAFV